MFKISRNTQFQRRHEYVTVVNDLTTSEPRVLYVAERSRAALDGYFEAVGEAGCGRIQMVAMDMWPAYIRSVREHTEALIAFDRFHVAQHLGAAVDQFGGPRTGPCGNKATTGC